jgi:hypothetical protein
MKNPESVSEFAESEEADFEDILYVAIDAFRNSTGEEFPYDKLTINHPTEPAGERWDEDRVGELFPALWEKYAD